MELIASIEDHSRDITSLEYFNNLGHLLDILKLASKTFSRHVFICISIGMLIVILLVFRSVSFALSGQSFSAALICFVIGFACFTITIIFLIISLNITSAYLENEVCKLRESLNNRVFLEHVQVYIKGQIVSAKEAKHIMIENLKDYNGYDGLGYFNLGRPLLTGIMANFATYFIVLVQFKLTEMTM